MGAQDYTAPARGQQFTQAAFDAFAKANEGLRMDRPETWPAGLTVDTLNGQPVWRSTDTGELMAGIDPKGGGLLSYRDARAQGINLGAYGFPHAPFGLSDLLQFASVAGPLVAGPLGAVGGEVGTASMPPAIPEGDPTFGGALQQTAPGVFEAATGADALGTAAGPPVPSVPTDTFSPSPGFPAPPLASAGVSYAGLPAGDPAAPGVYGGPYSIEPGGFEPSVFDAARIGSENTNPLDWLKQLSKSASPYLNLASAGLGLYSASRAGRTPSPAPVYDPFAGQRGQYQQQLSRLSADPNYLTQLPGYKAGIEATRRGMAAGGYNISGNEEAALFNYGGNVYNQEATRLATLAGANIGPMVSGASPSNVAQADLVSRSLASLGYAARSFAAGG